MENLDKFLKEINELKEAKELLDRLLVHYKIYENRFDNEQIQMYDKNKLYSLKKNMSLNDAIRTYLKFDDSE